MKVVPVRWWASVAKSASCQAAIGSLCSCGWPCSSKTPKPVPSGFLLLCSDRLSGASSSQNVAVTTSVPACKPKSRHMVSTVAKSARQRVGQVTQRQLRVALPDPGEQRQCPRRQYRLAMDGPAPGDFAAAPDRCEEPFARDMVDQQCHRAPDLRQQIAERSRCVDAGQLL